MERNYIQLCIIFKEVKDHLSELERKNTDNNIIVKLRRLYYSIENLINRNRK